jgi:hypothetical protein
LTSVQNEPTLQIGQRARVAFGVEYQAARGEADRQRAAGVVADHLGELADVDALPRGLKNGIGAALQALRVGDLRGRRVLLDLLHVALVEDALQADPERAARRELALKRVPLEPVGNLELLLAGPPELQIGCDRRRRGRAGQP